MKKQEKEYQDKYNYDMAWGNPYFLLDILHSMYGGIVSATDVRDMSYASDLGDEKLIKLTRNAIKQSSNLDYKYVIITAGATQAISSILKYRKHQRGYQTVITPEYGYPFYEDMINNLKMQRIPLPLPFDSEIPKEIEIWSDPMYLIDSPSNPLGNQYYGDASKHGLTIWDGVYHNKIYTKDLNTFPNSICMVGSYSKLLGLTGSRVGWIATNDPFFFDKMKEVSLKDTGTVSVPSQNLLIDILQNIDLEYFLNRGSVNLDQNREAFQKIEYLFDNQPVQEVGMFYCAHGSKKAKEILNKASVKYVTLEDDMVRLSMGQTREVTEKAIRTILRKDMV